MTRKQGWMSNVAALWVMQLLSYALPLVTLPYLVRTLSLSGYGRIVFAASVIQFVVLFIDSGFNLISQRNVARGKGDVNAVSTELATSIVARGLIAITAILPIAMLVLIEATPTLEGELLVVSGLLVLGTLAFPQWLFIALQDTRPMLVCHLIGRAIPVALIFIFVRSANDIMLAATLQASGTLLSGVVALAWLIRTGKITPRYPKLSLVKELVVSGARIGLPTFLVAAASNATVFLLGLFASSAAVGVYGAVEKIIRAAGGLFNAVVQAAFPILCARYQASNFEQSVRTFSTVAVSVAAFGTAIAWIWAEPLLVFAFGAKFSEHGYLLAIMAPAMVGTCMALCAAHFVLLARQQDTRFSAVQMVVAAIAWTAYFAAATTAAPGTLALAFTGVELLSAALMWVAVYWPQRERHASA